MFLAEKIYIQWYWKSYEFCWKYDWNVVQPCDCVLYLVLPTVSILVWLDEVLLAESIFDRLMQVQLI